MSTNAILQKSKKLKRFKRFKKSKKVKIFRNFRALIWYSKLIANSERKLLKSRRFADMTNIWEYKQFDWCSWYVILASIIKVLDLRTSMQLTCFSLNFCYRWAIFVLFFRFETLINERFFSIFDQAKLKKTFVKTFLTIKKLVQLIYKNR